MTKPGLSVVVSGIRDQGFRVTKFSAKPIFTSMGDATLSGRVIMTMKPGSLHNEGNVRAVSLVGRRINDHF